MHGSHSAPGPRGFGVDKDVFVFFEHQKEANEIGGSKVGCLHIGTVVKCNF